MLEIVLASTNKGKIREFQSLFDKNKVKILSLHDIGFDKDIIEDGSTFEENATIKATEVYKFANKITVADDSGLEVFSLNNAPGIYSARYAGEMHDDNLNNEKLVKELTNKEDRRCRYVCAICLILPGKKPVNFIDYCYGEIHLTPKGENGFGYDPYFYVKEFGKTFAEVSLEEKNTISHRAKALRKVQDYLNGLDIK